MSAPSLIDSAAFQKEFSSKDALNYTANEAEFAEINVEFQRVLAAMAGDEQMTKFRQEYEKMFKALTHSRDNSSKFMNQHLLLEKEYASNVEASQTTMQASLDDQATINTLKSTIAKIQEGLVVSAHREETGKEALRLLRGDISSLVMTVKQGVGLSAVQEKTLQDLHQTKEEISKELEREIDQIVSLRSKILEVTESIKQTDEQKRTIEYEIYEAKEKNTLKKGDIEVELRNKERLEKELRDIRSIVSSRLQEDTVNKCTEDIQAIDHHIKSQHAALDRLQKDQESLILRSVKLKESCSDQIATSATLAEENKLLEREILRKTQDLSKLHGEIKKINKIRDALLKRNKGLEEQKAEIESKRREAKEENDSCIEEIAKIKRQVEVYKKTLDDFQREKALIQDSHERAIVSTQSNLQLMIPFKQTRENLELEIARYQKEVHEQKKSIAQIELERDYYVKEAASLQAEVVDSISQIKKKEIMIYDYKKQMVQADTKLKHQQALYEAVQSDRNLHAKHLVENLAEIAEMKRKLKIMNYQINGYKEDINSKDEYLATEKAENNRLLKDIGIITEETKNLKNQNEIAQAYIKTQLVEELKLNHFVKEAELERTRQENSWQVLISERDNLCNQLMKQDEELTKVYGKIKSNTTSLMTSEKQYFKKLYEISKIHNEIRNLSECKRNLASETNQLKDMKLKLCRLEHQVIFEKTRVKALEEELENQINVHRWRKLEGSNPKGFEMIQLQQALQKKLLEKSSEEEDKTRQIAHYEEIYLHCKTLLANQVGPEAFEQIKDYEKMLKEKQLQLKHMSTELNMYQAQGKEYKYGIEKLDREIAQLKDTYITEYYKSGRKRRETTVINMGLPQLPSESASGKPKNLKTIERGSFPSTSVVPPIESTLIAENFEDSESAKSINDQIEVIERIYNDLQSNSPPNSAFGSTDNISGTLETEQPFSTQNTDENLSNGDKLDNEDSPMKQEETCESQPSSYTDNAALVEESEEARL